MEISASVFWLILAGILIILEVTVLTGFGLLIAALGAISLGMMFLLGIAENFLISGQIAMFLSLSSIWWVALWKPGRMKSKSSNDSGGN